MMGLLYVDERGRLRNSRGQFAKYEPVQPDETCPNGCERYGDWWAPDDCPTHLGPMTTERHVPPGDDGERAAERLSDLLHNLPTVWLTWRGDAKDNGTHYVNAPLDELADWLAASSSRTGDRLREKFAAVLAEEYVTLPPDTVGGTYQRERVAHVADALADTLGETGC